MEGQTLIFSHHPFGTPSTPFYSPYHTPPYTLNVGPNNTSPWPEYTYPPASMNEDVLQMQQQQQHQQQLRFPTPPITPPRSFNSPEQELQPQPQQQHQHPVELQHQLTTPQRTQSVIMKIGHDQSPHYLPADLPYTNTTIHRGGDNHPHHQNHDTPSSGTSSPSSNNDFVCNWVDCGRYFESLEFLAIHVTQIHAVASIIDGLYYCRWAGCHRTQRGFNARYKMLVHVRTHTKEKPHQCHLCSKRFSRAENLKIHIRSHSGEKPYICSFEGCNKAYSNSSDRFKHTRTHSMEKPYMCKVPGCQKRYTDPSSLRKHVKTFKHSVQMVHPKPTTSPPTYMHQQQYQHPIHNSPDESRFSPLETQEQTYPSYHLVMTAAPTAAVGQDSFCMAMEEMCHIRATLDCYKTTPHRPVDSDNYWLNDEAETKSPPNFHSHFHSPTLTRGDELTLDLTSDKPLDLRVNRLS